MLLDIYRSMGGIIKPLTISEILKTNKESRKYGLALSPAEAYELIEARNRSIQNHGRVELGIEAVKKIITAFCNSPFISPEDYALTLNELIEIFYYMKNQTDDKIGDDELISIMQEFFNTSCHGSLELLKNRELALFAQDLRYSNTCIGSNGNETFGY